MKLIMKAAIEEARHISDVHWRRTGCVKAPSPAESQAENRIHFFPSGPEGNAKPARAERRHLRGGDQFTLGARAFAPNDFHEIQRVSPLHLEDSPRMAQNSCLAKQANFP